MIDDDCNATRDPLNTFCLWIWFRVSIYGKHLWLYCLIEREVFEVCLNDGIIQGFINTFIES